MTDPVSDLVIILAAAIAAALGIATVAIIDHLIPKYDVWRYLGQGEWSKVASFNTYEKASRWVSTRRPAGLYDIRTRKP